MEVRNIGLHVLLIVVPGHTIDSDSCRFLQVEERFGQTVFADMVQQGGEFERAVLAGSFTHAVQAA